MKNFIQLFLIKYVSKLSFKVGQLHLPWIRKLVTAQDYRSLILSDIKEGDVLISITCGEAGNLAIPGQFSHAAIYKGNKEIVESVGSGVRSTDILDFLFNKDYVAVYRSNFASDEEKMKAVAYCISQIGKPYNFGLVMTEDDSAHYCCEVIYKGYNKAVPNNPFKLKQTLGIDTVIPDDFKNADKKWVFVWQSASCKNLK